MQKLVGDNEVLEAVALISQVLRECDNASA